MLKPKSVVTLYCIILFRASGAGKEILHDENESVVSDIYNNKLKALVDHKRIVERDGDQYVFQTRSSNQPPLTF